MTTTTDLIEEWIEIRAKLQRQLKVLDSSEKIAGAATEFTVSRLKRFIGDLNELLKEHARVDPS